MGTDRYINDFEREDETNRHAELDSTSTPILTTQAVEIPDRVRDDKGLCCEAFTLIELLVVVLIIAILASIAVPQYQKAVTKSRAAHLQTLLAEVVRASDLYYLQHGEYPKTFKDMDIDIGIPTVTTPSVKCENGNLLPSAQKEADGIGISIYGGNKTTLIHNIISVHFTTGKYKCRGFVHYQLASNDPQSPVNKHTYCGEYYYNRSCGMDCDRGAFCEKVMGKKYKAYQNLMHIYE